MTVRNIFQSKALAPQRGGAVLIAILLIACLLLGLAAGFTARALTGERRQPAASAISWKNQAATARSTQTIFVFDETSSAKRM